MGSNWRDEWDEPKDEEKLFWFPLSVAVLGLTIAGLIGFAIFATITGRESYCINLFTTLFSIFFTVGVIELFNQRRARRQLKAQLIRQMGGRDTGIAFGALRELAENGWLTDGSLKGKDFRKASLQGTLEYRADMQRSDLRKADFRWAELHYADFMSAKLQEVQFGGAKLKNAVFWDANLEGAQMNSAELHGVNFGRANLRRVSLHGAKNVLDDWLVSAKRMRFAVMPDNRIYDGRFCLRGDIEDAQREGVNIKDIGAMAEFYGVSIEEYGDGQSWLRDNLERLLLVDNSQIHVSE
jgi:uncharacterized protein YjbI with pentapeptide repeats